MQVGKFITLEGGEGAGKSTQANRLAEQLQRRGIDPVLTREPGGAPQAEELRSLLVDGDEDRWSAVAETLLNYAARDDHLRHTIIPALTKGRWVISDRFSDSTRAYQGDAGKVSKTLISVLDEAVVGDNQPDLTLIFDMAPEIGLERARERGGPDRFERKGLAFHNALREAFLAIARSDPERCVVIPADGSQSEVEAKVWAAVETRLLA